MNVQKWESFGDIRNSSKICMSVPQSLTKADILLGMLHPTNDERIDNHILIARYCIYRNKSRKEMLNLQQVIKRIQQQCIDDKSCLHLK